LEGWPGCRGLALDSKGFAAHVEGRPEEMKWALTSISFPVWELEDLSFLGSFLLVAFGLDPKA